jgi:hypothetical protein
VCVHGGDKSGRLKKVRDIDSEQCSSSLGHKEEYAMFKTHNIDVVLAMRASVLCSDRVLSALALAQLAVTVEGLW